MSEPKKHEPYSGADATGESPLPEGLSPDGKAGAEVRGEPPPHDSMAVGEGAVYINGPASGSVVVAGDGHSINIGYDGLHSLSEFEVKEQEKDELLSSFVRPVNYDEVAREVGGRRLIWIFGPPEAGKGTLALHLAFTRLHGQSTYKIHGTRTWSMISKSEVKNSTVVLIDAVYLAATTAEVEAADFEALDESELEDEELDAAEATSAAAEADAESEGAGEVEAEDGEAEDPACLIKGLLDRGNTVIITSNEEVYEKARGKLQAMALAGMAPFPFRLSSESYWRAQRLELIKKAVNLAHTKWRSGEVKQAALRACDELARGDGGADDAHPILRDWLPGEICSFVTSVLVNAKSADEVEAELKVPLSTRVQTWFVHLNDESIRVFVLARTIFPALGEDELHDKMREIVNRLKGTYSLSLTAVGVYADRATPYISSSPPFRFVNDHVRRAVSDVVATFYHRQFAELSELLQMWSVPEGLEAAAAGEGPAGGEAKRKQDQLIKESAPVRDAVARMAGRVGRYNLASVSRLLNCWAGHRFGRIGQAAGIALRHAVVNEGNYEDVFQRVESWARKPSHDDGNYFKRSAADALWRLATAGLPPARREQVLRLLEYLARDSNAYVRRTAAYALAQVLEAYGPTKVRRALETLASDHRDDVRTHFAVYLASAVRRQRDEFRPVAKEWIDSSDEKLSEVAVLYLLCNWGRADENALLRRVMAERPALFERVMKTAVRLAMRRRGGSLTWPALRRILDELASRGEDPASEQAIAAVINLRRWSATAYPEGEAHAKALLKKWDYSENASLRLAACACHFAAGRSAEERLSLLKERLGPFVSADQDALLALVAKRLVLMAGQDRHVVRELLQHWLVNGDDNAIAAVVFYWLLAPDGSEPERYRYLTSILYNFPQPFESAMRQATESLPVDTFGPVLQSLASDERLLVRKQVAITLGRMTARNGTYVYRLLEDWLALDDSRAGATVVLFWIAAGDYTPEQRRENLEGILRSFPRIFERGISDAVDAWGAGCLEPLGDDLRQHSFPPIPRGGEGEHFIDNR